MATLSLPAWGYGLRYRYGLFKQLMTKTGQEEYAEDWLEVCWLLNPNIANARLCHRICENSKLSFPGYLMQKFSPWEIPRHDVVFPIRFFGQVEVNPDGS